MRAPFLSSLHRDERREFWRRFGALIVVVLIHILGVIGLMLLAPEYNPLKKLDRDFTLLNLKVPPPPPPVKHKARDVVSNPKAGGAVRKAPEPVAPPPPLNMLVMDSKTFAASNIGTASSAPAGPVVAENDGAPSGKGNGPDGSKIYGVDWYREPTDAQLDYYFQNALGFLRKNSLGKGWGTVACLTAPGYRVENCHELDESPAHSGFARAVREASWQFEVMPRRLGDRPLIGEWVFVTIEFTLTGARLSSDSSPSIDPAKLRAFKSSYMQSGATRTYGPTR